MTIDKTITLGRYYRSFKSLSGVLAAITVISPVVTKILPAESLGSYLFPPLGIAEGPARIGTVVLALAMTFLAFFLRRKQAQTNRNLVVGMILGTFIFIFLYFAFYSRFVRTLEIPSLKTSITVSVGYERTEFANKNFGSASDWELLRQRGTGEEEISILWTHNSLLTARLALYISYCMIIVLLVLAFSFGVLSELDPQSSTKNG